MKYAAIIILIFMSLAVLGQEMTYEQWKQEATTNIRLLPEYGNIEKTDGQKKADYEFIESSLKTDGSYSKSSEHLVELGFKYLIRGDLKTAMYRFNQSWLMQPDNANSYWGFGAIYFSFNDYDAALKMYDKGLKLDPKSSNILTDKATVYMAMLNTQYDQSIFDKALTLFNESRTIDPKNQNTTYKLSTLYFLVNDCKNAMKYYNECKKDGGQPITDEYTKALFGKCK